MIIHIGRDAHDNKLCGLYAHDAKPRVTCHVIRNICRVPRRTLVIGAQSVVRRTVVIGDYYYGDRIMVKGCVLSGAGRLASHVSHYAYAG